jgi:hypothetical protein
MPRRVRFLVRAAAFLCLAATTLAAFPALAHSSKPVADDSGIAIPALTHGQMAVIADYRSQILDLAARQVPTNEPFRRLMNFGAIQYAYCLWGLVPGSLRDEESPFNECSHAYLSATQALLLYMRTMPENSPAFQTQIDSLASRIDADMVRSGASLVLCQFSDEAFNTASLIRPTWSAIPSHPPSLIAFAVLAMGLTAGTIGLAGGRRPRPSA